MFVLTADYELAHGKSPRGYGRWAFSTERNPDVLDAEKVFWFTGTYGDAKKVAKLRFQKAHSIYVLS